MSTTLWIVVAFAVGVLFGRLTAGGGTSRSGGPTGMAPGTGPGSAPGFAHSLNRATPSLVAGSPNGAYHVTLLDKGPNTLQTIKTLRAITRVGLKDAKEMVDAAPREIVRVDTPEQAEAIVRAFQGVAGVRLDGPGGRNLIPDFGFTKTDSDVQEFR